MLHEILLSLSGHPSPLLRSELPDVSLPERQLLVSAAELSELHISLVDMTARIAGSHPSTICRAVATAIKSMYLAAFQRKVLDVESSILKDDPDLVGAYNIVPLTAVMGEFKQWTRRMKWMWETVVFMQPRQANKTQSCCGAALIERLRGELQSGYRDIEETAMTLLKAAETAWLRQVSAWVFYGKLPSVGAEDFFIHTINGSNDYAVRTELIPSFVTRATVASIMFIGKSINHIRGRKGDGFKINGISDISAHLKEFQKLQFPINSISLAKSISALRLSLSQTTLQAILPAEKVVEMLQLLREFFLLGRGEFAMALTQEADERIRNRWRRAANLGPAKDSSVANVVVKDGEVAAVLARTWSSMATLQGQSSVEDIQMDLARVSLRLLLVKEKNVRPNTGLGLDTDLAASLAASPFHGMLFSVPAMLSIQLPSPLDMVISESDLQIYSCVHSYLISLRRAHLRLTDLWKLTSLRRHHPSPRGTDDFSLELRRRWSQRTAALRSTWTTASASIFFLAETEAYLQTEVVTGLWQGFLAWLTGSDTQRQRTEVLSSGSGSGNQSFGMENTNDSFESNQEQLSNTRPSSRRAKAQVSHDQQTLSTGHSLYLRTLVHRLLLTQTTFTEPLHALLVYIDHLVSHLGRLHSIYTAIDLETDAGVVDSFTDLEADERQVMAQLRSVEGKVRHGIYQVVAALESLSNNPKFLAEWEGDDITWEEEDELSPGEPYRPRRLGGLDRLLMKLDFGSWFGDRLHD